MPSGRRSSEANVELVRRAVEEFNRFGFAGAPDTDLFAERFEFHEPPEQPAPRVARGADEVRDLGGQFDAAWEEHRTKIREVRALAGDRVLLETIEHFKGRDGIELETPCTTLFTLRDGEILRMQPFWDRRNALAAAGLPE